MKTIRFFVLSWLATAIVCHAQQPPSLLIGPADIDTRQAAVDATMAQQANMAQPLTPQPLFNVPSTPIAEALTPDILALARGLENDPLRIFNYVHDHIRHVLYFGAKKGAELTLLEKSGNDFDQCALLVALLHAANYTNTVYEFGWMELPYDSAADHKDLHHWLQLSLVNTNWGYTSNYLRTLIYGIRGYPATAAIWDNNTFAFQRLWVKLSIGSTNYYLDPSFKVSEPIPNLFNLTNVMQYTQQFPLERCPRDRYRELCNQPQRSVHPGYASGLHDEPAQLHSEQLPECKRGPGPQRLANHALNKHRPEPDALIHDIRLGRQNADSHLDKPANRPHVHLLRLFPRHLLGLVHALVAGPAAQPDIRLQRRRRALAGG